MAAHERAEDPDLSAAPLGAIPGRDPIGPDACAAGDGTNRRDLLKAGMPFVVAVMGLRLGSARAASPAGECGTYDDTGQLYFDNDCYVNQGAPDGDCGLTVTEDASSPVASDQDCGLGYGTQGNWHSDSSCGKLGSEPPEIGPTYWSDLECAMLRDDLTSVEDRDCGLAKYPSGHGPAHHQDNACALWNGVYYYKDEDCGLSAGNGCGLLDYWIDNG